MRGTMASIAVEAVNVAVQAGSMDSKIRSGLTWAGCQPWRCLCFGLVQITMTLPWRRITRHFSHMRFTEARTFICGLFY